MGHFQILFIIFLIFYLHNSVQSDHPFLCNPQQSLALLQFKSNFVINSSASLDWCGTDLNLKTESWKESTDCCYSWDGVKCDDVTGHVIVLYLSCSQLQDVSNNKIQGPILKWMFDGGKYALSAIKSLDLSSNLLQGPLPIPPSTTSFFSVSNNELVGEIPSQFCGLSILEFLDLSHNKLAGLIPQCLGNSSTLSVLNLRKNRLEQTIPNSFPKVNSLNYLDLNGNRLGGPLPQSLMHCQNLQVLDLGNNMIEEIFPHWLEALQRLEVLVLRSNKFFGSLNSSKAKFFFSKLRILDLSNNRFTGELPIRLINNLEAMMMSKGLESGNQYMTLSNDSYHSDSYYSMVITVKGVDMKYVKILNTLATLDLSSNKFEGEIPKVIGKLHSLKGLNLSHNFLSGHIPSGMGDLINLEWLDLSSNKLSGHIPRHLADLTFLEVINLSHNRLSGPIPQGKQFNTFENSSFKDNFGLCGFPLSKGCGTNHQLPPSIDVKKYSSDTTSRFDWQGAYVGWLWNCIRFVYGIYGVFNWVVGVVCEDGRGKAA